MLLIITHIISHKGPQFHYERNIKSVINIIATRRIFLKHWPSFVIVSGIKIPQQFKVDFETVYCILLMSGLETTFMVFRCVVTYQNMKSGSSDITRYENVQETTVGYVKELRPN